MPCPGVEYRVARAEASGLPDSCIDLLTVGQALHWFDQQRFAVEAARVIKAGGLLVCICYTVCTVDEPVDAVVRELYADILDAYWPPERTLVESGYQAISLPGTEVGFPQLALEASWTAEAMLGYLRTWSASKRYEKAQGQDPVSLVAPELRDAWGEASRVVRWPLAVRATRL